MESCICRILEKWGLLYDTNRELALLFAKKTGDCTVLIVKALLDTIAKFDIESLHNMYKHLSSDMNLPEVRTVHSLWTWIHQGGLKSLQKNSPQGEHRFLNLISAYAS